MILGVYDSRMNVIFYD